MVQIPTPDTKEIAEECSSLVAQGKIFVTVTNEDDLLTVTEYLQRNKEAQKKVKERMKEPKDLLNRAHKSICALENSFLDPLIEREKACKEGVKVYLIDKQAREKAEQDRLQKEHNEKIAREQKEAEEKQKAERDRIAAQAIQEGRPEAAKEILAAPIYVPPPVQSAPVTNIACRSTTKVKGLTIKDKWIYEIEDPSLVPERYKSIDPKKIQNEVDLLGNEARIPGIKVLKDMNIGSRRA